MLWPISRPSPAKASPLPSGISEDLDVEFASGFDALFPAAIPRLSGLVTEGDGCGSSAPRPPPPSLYQRTRIEFPWTFVSGHLPNGTCAPSTPTGGGGGRRSLEPLFRTPPFRGPVTGTPDGLTGAGFGGGGGGPEVPQHI